MIIELDDKTCVLLQKVKEEFGQPLSDEDAIRDALMYYHLEIAQINRQKNKYVGRAV